MQRADALERMIKMIKENYINNNPLEKILLVAYQPENPINYLLSFLRKINNSTKQQKLKKQIISNLYFIKKLNEIERRITRIKN